MKTDNLSETESSQCSRAEDQPPLGNQASRHTAELTEEGAMKLIKQISDNLKTAKGNEFLEMVKTMVKIIQKGYASSFLKFPSIMLAMMKHFCSQFKKIESDPAAQGSMIFILSAIGELIREAGRFDFPFTEKFLKTIFTIDEELLANSPYRDGILAILGVLYQNLSKQGRLLKKLNLSKELKHSILTNYCLVNEDFSARLFNKSLYNLALQGEAITEAELHKFKVFATLSKFLQSEQINTLISKIRSALSKSSVQKEIREESTAMIAEI